MDEWRNKLKKQQQEAPPSSFLTESPAPPSTSPPSLVGVTTTAAAAALDSAVHSAIKGLNNAMLTVIAGGGGADDATSATTVKSPPCSSSSSSSPLPPSQPQPLEANVVGSFPTTTTTTTSSGSTLKNEQTQQSPFDLAYSYLQSSISSSSSAPAVNWNELATAFQLPATLLDNVDNKLLRPVALFIYPLLKPVLATLTDPASQRRAFNRILLSISLSVLFILAACFYAAFFNLYLPSGERSAQIYLNYGSGNGGGGGFYGLHGFHNNGGGYQHHHHQQKSVTASLPAPFGRLDIYQPLSDELTTRPHSPTASHQQHQIKNHGNHNYQHDSSAFFEEEESNRFFKLEEIFDIQVGLVVPESTHNFDRGNFMVGIELFSGNNVSIAKSARPGLVRHKSGLLQILSTLYRVVFLVTGVADESQMIRIPMLEHWMENAESPTSHIILTISDPHLRIYTSTIIIRQRFLGLHYYMYHRRITTATLFIILFMALEACAFFIWWRLFVWWRVRRKIAAERMERERELEAKEKLIMEEAGKCLEVDHVDSDDEEEDDDVMTTVMGDLLLDDDDDDATIITSSNTTLVNNASLALVDGIHVPTSSHDIPIGVSTGSQSTTVRHRHRRRTTTITTTKSLKRFSIGPISSSSSLSSSMTNPTTTTDASSSLTTTSSIITSSTPTSSSPTSSPSTSFSSPSASHSLSHIGPEFGGGISGGVSVPNAPIATTAGLGVNWNHDLLLHDKSFSTSEE